MAETKAATTKKTTTAKKATTAGKTAAAKKYAYIFFNCDDDKSQNSLNIRYNNKVYRDTKTSRKALLDKVMKEVKEGRVNLADKDAVSNIILEGNPTEASKLIQYGTIERVVEN